MAGYLLDVDGDVWKDNGSEVYLYTFRGSVLNCASSDSKRGISELFGPLVPCDSEGNPINKETAGE